MQQGMRSLIPALSESAKRVMAALMATGPTSRPQLSEETGLSKQTVSLAMEELAATQLVEVISSRQGHTGRAASIYDLSRRSGWLLGVDFGSTHIRLAATSLGGSLLVERDLAVSGSPNKANADFGADARIAVRRLIAELTEDCGPLLTICVAFSRAVPRLKDWNSSPEPDDPQDVQAILKSLEIPAGVSFYAENNVNCAVLGEAWKHRERPLRDAAYLQIGVGIGAGIMTNGQLLRGVKGMAGELRYLPSPFCGGGFANAEEALSSRGIVARYNRRQAADGQGGARSARDVFDRAAQGQPIALEVLGEEAEGMAVLIAALASVANPRAVILGGGIGQNPALRPLVKAAVRQMSLPVDIWSSELGESATVAGAALLARSLTLAELLGIHFDGNLLPAS